MDSGCLVTCEDLGVCPETGDRGGLGEDRLKAESRMSWALLSSRPLNSPWLLMMLPQLLVVISPGTVCRLDSLLLPLLLLAPPGLFALLLWLPLLTTCASATVKQV